MVAVDATDYRNLLLLLERTTSPQYYDRERDELTELFDRGDRTD